MRAKALSLELATPITPGFEALVFKASRGIEDIYELTYIRKDGSRFPAVVSVTALRGADNAIIGYLLIGTDNTARKQAQEQGDRFFKLSQDMLCTIGFDGYFKDLNPAWEKALGFTKAELLAKPFIEFVHADDRAKTLAVDVANMSSGKDLEDFQNRYVCKDGSVRYIQWSVTPVIGERLIFGSARDITERKIAEEALREAGALQSAIFNSANFSSIATDAKGVIQIFNVGAERMLGYAAADVMNKITPADISDPQEVINRAQALSLELGTTILPGFEALVFKASRGIEDIYELTYIRQDGSRFPAIVSVTALRGDDGGIIGYLLIGTDNTARKQIEEERKKLNQRLRDQQFYTRSLIEANMDAILTTDPQGIITDVNKQMEALTSCTRDELIGAPFKNCFTDPERAEAGITLVLSEKKVTNYELTARARDGNETVVSYNATTFYDRERNLQGVFAAARDVTERKRFELALQETNVELETAKSAAEKANLAKSDFLSSMSHELRSPLNAILGFAQLMEMSTPPPTPSQAGRISQILQAGWHLLNLINEILDLAVIEAGKVSLSIEPVSLDDVLLECEAMMETQAEKRRIKMTFPLFGQSGSVLADRTRLKQIVINLLSNAIKYNKDDGTVEVKCVKVMRGRIRISVRDTGSGIPPEKMAQMFQPFNRLGKEAGTIAGTGIGLVVTKQLAELMGGVIGVESVAGEGSVFWIELDSVLASSLAPEEVASAVTQFERRDSIRVRTVLYVEDNPANMTLVEQLIAGRPDLRLLTAVNGTLGIAAAKASLPDVILMDTNLPGISGIDALKILRDDPITAHIPVIALSANAMMRDIKLGIDIGFNRYLTKPIKVKEFFEALDSVLELAERPAVTVKAERVMA